MIAGSVGARLALVALVCGAWAACSSDVVVDVDEIDFRRPTSVSVTPDMVEMSAIGDTARLSAEVFDQHGNVIVGSPVVWASGNRTVAVVAPDGLATAVATGMAMVTAKADFAVDTAVVTVLQSVRSVALSPTKAVVFGPGDALQLSAAALDANGHPVPHVEIAWESSDTTVVAVTQTGWIQGLRDGEATVTATADSLSDEARVTVINPDRAALEAIYRATGGDGWVRNENWMTRRSLAAWHGVRLDGWGRVSVLELWRNGLTGEIPPEIGNLSRLVELDLGNRWYLFSDMLAGSIAPESDNHSNPLRGTHWNRLSGGRQPEIGSLSDQPRLDTAWNQLSGSIPAEIGNLSYLRRLDLDSNQLTGGIPPEIGNLSDLRRLELASNQLTGSIPPEIGQMSQLRSLFLYRNQLTGSIPPETGKLSRLGSLVLTDNRLTGEIPPEIGRLSNLAYLWLSSNRLVGSIPPEIGQLDKLYWLVLHANLLTGEIPPEIGQMSVLAEAYLSENQLSGEIPPEIAQASNLWWLSLHSNHLTGEIPPGIVNLTQLKGLYLHGNSLTGSLPDGIGSMAGLYRIHIHSNPLSGPLPTSLTRLPMEPAGSYQSEFHFHETQLCVPQSDTFQRWLAGIDSVRTSGLECN